MEFPVHLYRVHPNGTWPLMGTAKLHKITSAHDADEMAALLDAGWFLPGGEAADDAPVADNVPPTRAELVQKAKELGLTFHHKTGDAKLLAMIEAALEG